MKKLLFTTLLLCSLSSTGWALTYNQPITAIFGSGNPDGGWTIGTGGGLTLGLRAKNRDTGAISPTPNLDGYYTYAAGYSVNAPTLALWNFEFSINSGSQSLSSYDFYLGVDTDASLGVNYAGSLISPLTFLGDNSYGLSTTGNGLGTESSFATAMAEGHTIAQNSLNIAFAGLNPAQNGIYDFRLFAVAKEQGNSPLPESGNNNFVQSSSPVADVNIRVTVGTSSARVPDTGSTLALIGLSLAGLAGISRRKIA